DAQGAVAHRRDARDHPHRRGLAGTIGTEEPERLALLDVEVDPVDRRELAEPLRQAAGMDERAGAVGHGRRRVPLWQPLHPSRKPATFTAPVRPTAMPPTRIA